MVISRSAALRILCAMFEPIAEQIVAITLYTDVFVVRGKLPTRQRRA
jgi:hypothetical protein